MAVIDSLVSYWSLDESSGNALDAHGSNPLTDNSSVGAGTGKVSGARDYQNGPYHSHADNADLSLGSDEAFSFCIWWKADQDPTASGRALLTKSSSEGSATEYSLWFSNGSSNLEFRVGNGSSSAVAADGLSTVNDTNWHFAVVKHDPVADQVSLRIDNGTAVTTSWSGGTQNGTEVFQLGAYTNWGLKWDGLIDEVGFWKKTLSSTEESWLYNSGAGRSYADIVAEAGSGTVIPVFMNQYRQRWS